MKLFLEKVNQKFNPEEYTTTGTANYTSNEEYGFSVDFYVSSTTLPTISFEDEIPCDVGEQFIVEIDYKVINGFYSAYYLYVNYAGQHIDLLSYNNRFTFTKTSSNLIQFQAGANGIINTTLSNVVIRRVGMEEVEILNSDEVTLTKQVKDFSTIGDVKGGFSNNITITYNTQNNKSIGFLTNITSSNINRLINGVGAIITTDDGNKIADGRVTIKQIIRTNDVYSLKLFFSSNSATFFNSLSKEKMEIEHLYINNTWQSIHNSNASYSDAITNEKYRYGFVDDGFIFEEDKPYRYALNKGMFYHDVNSLRLDNLTNTKNYEMKMPIDKGYTDFHNGQEPLLKHKYLLDRLHDKYGYRVEGSIFSNPIYTNLSSSVVWNEDIEADEIDPIVFQGSVETTGGWARDHSVLLTPSPATWNPAIYDRTPTAGVLLHNQPYPKYDVNTEDNNWTDLYGSTTAGRGYNDSVDGRIHDIQWLKNFKAKDVKLKITIEFNHNNGISGWFRVAIQDTLFTADSAYPSSSSRGSINMMPFSFQIVEDVKLEYNGSTSSMAYIVKEVSLDEVHYRKMQNSNSGYAIRVNLINDIVYTSANPIHIDVKVEMTNIKPIYERELNNSYYLDEQATLSYSEQDFMKDFINKYNLIPVVSVEEKLIKYFTFDEFYGEDSEELMADNIDRKKDIKYNYTMTGAKSSYKFKNQCKTSNDNMPDDYAEKIIDTKYKNKSQYTLTNIISNMYYVEDKGIVRGQGSFQKDYLGGFPLKLSTDTKIADQYIYFSDNKPFNEKRYKYNDKTKRSRCFIGYASKTPLSKTTINGGQHNNPPIYWKDTQAWYNIYTGANSGTYSTDWYGDNTPIYLSPVNKLDSFYIKEDNSDSRSYFGLIYDNSLKTSHNLFDAYEKQISNFNAPNTHSLKCYMILNEYEYANITMREKIIIDGNRYILKYISKYKPNIPTVVELITWKYSNGWKEVYKSVQSDINNSDSNTVIFSPDTITYLNIDDGYISPGIIGDINIGFLTNMHTAGKRYRVKMRIWSGQGGFKFKGYYRQGFNTSAYISKNIVYSANQWIELEYEYERTDMTSPTDILNLSEMILIETYNAVSPIIISNMSVLEN